MATGGSTTTPPFLFGKGMIRKKRVLTKDEIHRRKRQRHLFIKQRLKLFRLIRNTYIITIPLDWREYLKQQPIKDIVQDARDILYYSPTTEDYSIWIVLFSHYAKNFKHDPTDS